MLDSHLGGRRLSSFVDGEMVAPDADRWRVHLMRCPTCTGAVARERSVRERMRHSCVPAPSHDLLASLRIVAQCAEVTPYALATQQSPQQQSTQPQSAQPQSPQPPLRPSEGLEYPLPAHLPIGGSRRARWVAGVAVATTTTVAAAAVVSLVVVGSVGDPAAPGAPAAQPTTSDQPLSSPTFARAGFGEEIPFAFPYATAASTQLYGFTRLGSR